jgi:hypothetical protein
LIAKELTLSVASEQFTPLTTRLARSAARSTWPVPESLALRRVRRSHRGTFIDPENPAAALIGLVRATGFAMLMALAGCQPDPPPATPTAPASSETSAPAPLPAAPLPAATPVPSVALPSVVPPGPTYECELSGSRTPIEYADGVETLCRRHPEMGPCQYERDACRRRGGRVYKTANGEEVTAAVEAEYDRKVRRARFQAD